MQGTVLAAAWVLGERAPAAAPEPVAVTVVFSLPAEPAPQVADTPPPEQAEVDPVAPPEQAAPAPVQPPGAAPADPQMKAADPGPFVTADEPAPPETAPASVPSPAEVLIPVQPLPLPPQETAVVTPPVQASPPRRATWPSPRRSAPATQVAVARPAPSPRPAPQAEGTSPASPPVAAAAVPARVPPSAGEVATLDGRIRQAVKAAARYPAAAGMMGLAGRAKVEFDYRDGAVAGIRLVQSAGAPVLDGAALAAVHETIFHLLGLGGQRWAPSGRQHIALPGGASIDIGIENLRGRVNLNTASPELLRALFDVLGVEPNRAASLAAAILDWRTPGQRPRPGGAKAPQYRAAHRAYGPPGAPFRTLDELGDVLGMTPSLLASLRPHLTIWGDGDADPASAGPVVLAALRELGREAVLPDGTGADDLVIAITAEAVGPGGSRFERHAVVEIAPDPNGKPWRILAWTSA